MRLKKFVGEFENPGLERRFQLSMLRQNVQQTRIALYSIGALFLTFGLVDYYTVSNQINFYALLAVRITVALACVAMVAVVNRRPRLLYTGISINLLCLLLAEIALAGLVLILPNAVGFFTAQRLGRLQRRQYASLSAERRANRRLKREIQERRRLGDELRYLAQIDDLTGLNNRRWFLELANKELRRARRNNTSLTLCMLDLDHFKNINDQLGHTAGDRILSMVAQLCRAQLRETDIIGRFGGEEFIIALPDASVEDTQDIAERLRASIEGAELPDGLEGANLSVTVGIASVRDDEDSLESALQRADKALYAGKRDGRNTVVLA